eukprot:1477114-Ditylum_brightwellii.AAC.1
MECSRGLKLAHAIMCLQPAGMSQRTISTSLSSSSLEFEGGGKCCNKLFLSCNQATMCQMPNSFGF